MLLLRHIVVEFTLTTKNSFRPNNSALHSHDVARGDKPPAWREASRGDAVSMGMRNRITAATVLAGIGAWALLCTVVYGKFLASEPPQPLDPRFTHAGLAAHTLDSGARTLPHGAYSRHGFQTFTGHDAFAKHRHGGSVGGDAFPVNEGSNSKTDPYGGESVETGKGDLRVFGGHAAFETQRGEKHPGERDVRDLPADARARLRNPPELEDGPGLEKGRDAGHKTDVESKKTQTQTNEKESELDAIGMESAPEFREGEAEPASLDDVDEVENDPAVIGPEDLSADLVGIAQRIAARERREEAETTTEKVLKEASLGRKGNMG